MERNRSEVKRMSVKEMLDNVDFSMDEELSADGQEVTGEKTSTIVIVPVVKKSSAYLGPKLWDKNLEIQNIDQEEEEEIMEPYSEVMNIEDFLSENNINMDTIGESSPEPVETINIPVYSSSSMLDAPSPTATIDVKPQIRPSIIVAPKRDLNLDIKKETSSKVENNFLYAESKRAKLEREKNERRKKFEAQLDFAPEDLALATVPGYDFDPRDRPFDLDELKPQPIIKKRKKTFVPDESKDDKYWDKREKNNVAARRSREARRLKENQIALRAAFLEKENKVLKQELDDTNFDITKLSTERDILKKKLSRYETFKAS